jgi:methylenetetrahydrofolate dehydrogenase (NADP+)/methenyltetrahydrofolate cyclohydrolase
MILDGKKFAKERLDGFKNRSGAILADKGRKPHLAVVLVGSDPASQVYVGHKKKQCDAVGIKSTQIELPENCTAEVLKASILKLNDDVQVDGILVQLPLPEALSDFDPSEFILPGKDVDGLTAANMGLMIKGKAFAEPCTPKGVIELLKANNIEMSGKKAAVLGRSQIVGWPMAWMLTRENATVTVCHSRTEHLEEVLIESDIIVVAIGKPKFLNKDDFKPGSVVVDVGIHRLESGKLAGDVDSEGLAERNISYTPVPGGVGPMTVSQLLDNLLKLVEGK